MGKGSKESKYLEGNYSQNPIKAIKEYCEDVKQARELLDVEEYMKTYLHYVECAREEHHYLVEDAILTCTRCTTEPVTPIDIEFTAPEGSDEVRLKVTKNKRYFNGAGQYFATVDDGKKDDNIEVFGNCKNPPDREDEKQALIMAGESEKLRELGTCRYLMKLNDKWENMISDVGYQEVTELNKAGIEGITMESILFCKHGGLIYPRASGYIPTDDVDTEEPEEEHVLEEPDPSNPQAVKEYMWYFFIDAGFSEYATAGILGNVFAETGGTFDPATYRSSGSYYGVFQAGGGREKELLERGRERATTLGLTEDEGWKSVRLQCEYALDEYYNRTKENTGWVNNRYHMGDNQVFVATKENFENAQSASDAAMAWALGFERCVESKSADTINGNKVYTEIQGLDTRLTEADNIYTEFANTN